MDTLGTPRGLVIAAPSSGSGKTTLTLGICRALKNHGLKVQPFKCGPDYIDPAHHSLAAGRTSYNLDTWAMGRELIGEIVRDGAQGADICIVEGVMGLFDGAGCRGQCGDGSTADLAALLGWPVVLVMDVKGQSETAAAVALGCARLRNDVSFAGVILNRVAGDRHCSLIAPALGRIGLNVLGALPRTPKVSLAERHLGLVQAAEMESETHLEAMAELIAAHVDLDAVVQSAHNGNAIDLAPSESQSMGHAPPGQRIAIACDSAFTFMYPHLMQVWQKLGAELIPFSPLFDEPPDPLADAIWLPGGYPELNAGRLAAARRFKEGLREAAARNVPVHGECGGYMVLGTGLVDADGCRHEMTGLLELETSFEKRRLHLGYRVAKLEASCALGEEGQSVIGHEFHYASILHCGGSPLVDCRNAQGEGLNETGTRNGSVSGTFFHFIASA